MDGLRELNETKLITSVAGTWDSGGSSGRLRTELGVLPPGDIRRCLLALMGILEQRYGGNKMLIDCFDGKKRNCRVPGRLKRGLWLRPGDVVIIKMWELNKDRGDVLYKYRPNQVAWLKQNGYLKTESLEF